jgi:hypothetical protein
MCITPVVWQTDRQRGLRLGRFGGCCSSTVGHSACRRLSLSYRTADDLDRAIQLNEQALDGTFAGHFERSAMLADLGVALRERFRLGDDSADLDRVIELLEH